MTEDGKQIRRQEAAAIFAGCTAGRMRIAAVKESPRPAEPELTFQRNGVRLAAESTSPPATPKELEADGTAGMDDLLLTELWSYFWPN